MNPIDKTPKQIVKELNAYVIGQNKAKKAIAIALRNRYRRMQLSGEMQEEITPKNVLMIGPTGVGKTEIARRLAKIVQAPFMKVEATKFTEVGYVGRDVEAIVRDLVEVSYKMEADLQFDQVRAEARGNANKRLIKLLVPAIKKNKKEGEEEISFGQMFEEIKRGETPSLTPVQKEVVTEEIKKKRLSVREKLNKGMLEKQELTLEVDEPSRKAKEASEMLGQIGIDLGNTLNSLAPTKKVKRTMTVAQARTYLTREEARKLVNTADIAALAIKRAENTGIIFIDEIDKITSKAQKNSGEVSREGVQRDILPIVEGSQVQTKYGLINTDHILFIASGAFHESKPSDLIAELQGRFPIRVELDELKAEDFVKILTEPNNALIKQYIALIGTDNIKVTFTIEAIQKISEIAYHVNHENENIGARRLHTVLEKLLEDLLFEGPDMQMGDITITEAYVQNKIGNIAANKDLSQYIL
ncbi:ATP-dependent protease ATPase subunit HslU [Lactobacillus sp. UCMA15818]|uniref:ATP-dependent protease ATPase subunit HslU n=1 Tax=Lactobacillaceae TaxID=33958 RepID=UPI0025B1D02A|nr:ATP-dependent protease ATPase subunit HslU [Lactobacillus sp. UCMA15818]MDN2452260.1 ATP-dependent protease ATPase subunit HslU [Lactobacillus sp. UCMA15818]